MGKFFILCLLIVAGNGNALPSQPAKSEELPHSITLSSENQTLADIYTAFSISIAKSIVDNNIALEALTGPVMKLEPMCVPALDANAAFGLTHLLAIMNERIWPVAVPVFGKLLIPQWKSLPDSYALLLNKFLRDPDVTFSSVLFTTDNIEMTPGLKNLKVDIVKTDLSKKESSDTINKYLNKFIGTPLKENYIPPDATISPAAKAVLIDTLHVSEEWPSPVTKVPSPPKFNGVHSVEMVEIAGSFHVQESEDALEVLIPFKNRRRALSLILPKDMSAAINKELDEPLIGNDTSVKVQLPVFDGTIRIFEANLTSLCNFEKEENFVQLLDHLFFISLGQEKFETISITGAQVNDIKKFKDIKIDALEGGECISAAPKDLSLIPALPDTNNSEEPPERVITFDRSFSYTLLDEDLGTVIAGSVVSPVSSPAPASSSTPFIFGLENELSFAKCL